MKLTSFTHSGKKSWGLVDGTEILDLGFVFGDRVPDLKSAIERGGLAELVNGSREAPRISVAAIKYEPVIVTPDKILCVGHNYEEHRLETGRKATGNPTIFIRFARSQIGHEQDIIRPFVSEMLDYEGELAVIIGQGGRHIPEDEASRHIAGYACYNDVSVRDWQWHTHQFTPGKNFDGTGAFGPWLVTPDEVGELDDLLLQTRVDGQVVQKAHLGQLIFKIPRLIAYCSTFTRLEPGDVIVTGTPGGVGAKREPPLWLKAGSVVEVEISKLGLLRNSVVDETLVNP